MTPAPLDRRTLLRSGAALGATAVLIGGPEAAARSMRRVQPAQADQLAQGFGVVIHLHHRGSVYWHHEEVLTWVRRLGARHVRTRLSEMPEVLDAFDELARHGVRVQAVCGALGDEQSMHHLMRAVRDRFDHPELVFSAFEGINEPNQVGGEWVDETRRKTQELFEARAAYGLERIPIVAPSLARIARDGVEGETTWDQAGSLGDLSGYVDYGNMHVYPRGLPPSSDISYFRRCARRVSGPRPVMCTEGGYFTAMDYRGGAFPVPEDVAEAYVPQALLEHWLAGTRRFFRYELLDEPDAGGTDREGTLGMVDTTGTWSAKSDFWAVHALLRACDDPGPSFRPRPLRLSLTGGPGHLKHAVFARRNGTHVLALWVDQEVYDPQERKLLVPDLRQPMASVSLGLDSRRDISVRHLTDLGSETRTTSSSLRIALPPGVTLVTLR